MRSTIFHASTQIHGIRNLVGCQWVPLSDPPIERTRCDGRLYLGALQGFEGVSGSEAGAKKRGVMRTEGKGYIVQDGDVLHILFNV